MTAKELKNDGVFLKLHSESGNEIDRILIIPESVFNKFCKQKLI